MYTATVPAHGTAPPGTSMGATSVADMVGTALGVDLDVPCQANDPDLWFADVPDDLERAKALCVACPIKSECLAGALARHEPWGVWGGEIFERGAVIARKRPRGRPRKPDRNGASGANPTDAGSSVDTAVRGEEAAA
jgi:WhiB family redox-sensing transcriptional regulator